jgi:threonine dehydrogenase-like Zn-dependent dehydrogenase
VVRAIDARADGAFTAVVRIDGTLPAARLEGRLETLDGRAVGAPFTADMAAGQTTVTLTTRADAPRTWSAETPHLYRVAFTLYPHQTMFDVPAEAAVLLPDAVPPSRAVLAANMETALNATWDAAPGPSGRIAIVGVGVVGALIGFLCGRIASADVTLVDVDPARGRVAQAFGLKFAKPEAAPRDCGFVFHTSASAAGLATALDLAADEATVLELSWYGAGTVPVPLGGAFHSRRLKLISSQVGKVAPSRRSSVKHRQRLAMAIDLLADVRLDALIAPPINFDDLPAQLPRILAPGSGVLCQRIDYP